MFLNVGSKLFVWLAVLALYPVVGWGQEILVHPRDETVCAGEVAEFTSVVDRSTAFWAIDDTFLGDIQNEFDGFTMDNTTVIEGGLISMYLRFTSIAYTQFNNSKVQSAVLGADPGIGDFSTSAYLFYETNPQNPVTGLSTRVNETTVQIQWDALDSSLTTRFLVGIYDSGDNPVLSTGFLTTNDTFYIHHLDQGITCYDLEFRVTGVEIQYPHCKEPGQTTSTSIRVAYPDPNLTIGSVSLEISGQEVFVNWSSDDNRVLIVITNLINGNQTQIIYNGTSPYVYTEKTCGQLNLNVAVSPAQCAEPAFTHSANISFSIDCPTTVTTETETETTDQPSGAQASYPSLLLAIAAVFPLLKWQH